MIYHQADDSRIVKILFLNETDIKGDNYEYELICQFYRMTERLVICFKKLTFMYIVTFLSQIMCSPVAQKEYLITYISLFYPVCVI